MKRDLKTERCSMVFGNEKLRKSKEISEKLYPFLRVSPRVLSDVVFVMQGKIEGMLFQQPAERMRSFQYLFGTQNAERIRDLLHDDLTNLSVESRDEQIKQFKRKLAEEIDPPLSEALKTIEESNVLLLSEERRREIEITRDRHRRACYARDRVGQVEDAFQRAERDVEEKEKHILQWARKIEEAEKTLIELRPAADEARGLVTQAENFESIKGRREALELELAGARKLAEAEPTPCPATEEEILAAERDLMKLEGEYAQYQLLIKAGAAAHKDNHCPTCGQDIHQEHVLEAQLKVDRMKQPLDEMRGSVGQLKSALGEWKSKSVVLLTLKKGAKERIGAIESELVTIPTVESVDDTKVDEAREVLANYKAFENSVGELRARAKAAQDTLQALTGARQERERELQALRDQVSQDPGSEAVSGVEEALRRDENARMALERAMGIRDSLMNQKQSLEAQLKTWEAEEVKLARLRIWRDRVENARRLLHRDALPGQVARAFMGALNRRLAYYLELFGSTFTSEIAPDTLVTCSFPGQPGVPSERLSGGQKVILGVAFRFAIYDLFVSDLGVMILDEPTVYLDDNNVAAVAELLNHLKGFSKAAGIQLFVVTHEQQLADSFDQVVLVGS